MLAGNGEIYRCFLRGKFKKDFELKKDKQIKLDVAIVGDFVEFDVNEDGSGFIHTIKERENYISRKAPRIKGSSYRGERLEQIIAANIDLFHIVLSVKQPKFSNRQLDRILVIAESAGIKPVIIVNKSDLDKQNKMNYWKNLYEGLGYQFFLASALEKTNLDGIKEELSGNVNLFWGPSGVGKSSLLNVLYPELDLKVGEISDFTNKGKHTTVTSLMKEVEENTFIIDTPGVREIDPYGIKKEDVGHYFVEFEEYMHDCRFNTCTHTHEPECAVKEAVQESKISEDRYDSYLTIMDTIEDDMIY